MMLDVAVRVLIWAGGLIAVASAVGLVVYFAVKGFRWVDMVGVIGAVVGIVGLVIGVTGMILARRAGSSDQSAAQEQAVQARTTGEQPVRSGRAAGDQSAVSPKGDSATKHSMKARASGHSRIYQAGGDQHINDQ
ncbi:MULTISPECIES: hypothetical protein [unclassified Spirillospora]|uniref:hypothetical protein n=1 Tax=unclassified Spirillospora TaxID=2642701 RepID=UPI003722B7A3